MVTTIYGFVTFEFNNKNQLDSSLIKVKENFDIVGLEINELNVSFQFSDIVPNVYLAEDIKDDLMSLIEGKLEEGYIDIYDHRETFVLHDIQMRSN